MADVFEELSEDQNILTLGHKKYLFVALKRKVDLCARCVFYKKFGQCGNKLAVCMPLNRKDGRDGYWVEIGKEIDDEKT